MRGSRDSHILRSLQLLFGDSSERLALSFGGGAEDRTPSFYKGGAQFGRGLIGRSGGNRQNAARESRRAHGGHHQDDDEQGEAR